MKKQRLARRLREALRLAYDLGFYHGKRKAGITGLYLAKKYIGERMHAGWRVGDERHLRSAYSAGIWDREMAEKDAAEAAETKISAEE